MARFKMSGDVRITLRYRDREVEIDDEDAADEDALYRAAEDALSELTDPDYADDFYIDTEVDLLEPA